MALSLPMVRRASKCLVPGYSALYWCNEGAGTTLVDYSGNGYDGTFAADANAPSWSAQGVVCGVDDYVAIPRQTFAGAFTVMWAANRATQLGYDFILGDSASTNNKIGGDTGTANLIVKINGTAVNPAATLTPATYQSVAVVRDAADAVSVWVDGVSAASVGTVAGPFTFDRLGADNTASAFGGTISAFLAYPAALTLAQAQVDHGALKAVLTPRGIALA